MAQPDLAGYRIVEKLQGGPVADLYRAKQAPLERLVLIKALSPTILPSSPFAATLEREAALLSELAHPNIVRLYDFERRDDTMWLVLEHVDGWTLEELIAKLKRLAAPVAISIALEVARALDHAHEREVVHRNVQPKNVLVSKTGEIKLIDFAVASDERLPTAPELLESGPSFGMPSYMSPEQILGEPADPRSDLFSLGVVLYEMVSGKRPFDAPDDKSATQRIRHDAPPPLARDAPDVPAALERTLRRSLEKMPGDRFASAAELVQALETCLADTGGGSPRQLVASALHEAGLTLAPPRAATPTIASSPEHVSIAPAVRGLLVCLILILGGGAVIQWLAAQDSGRAPGRGGARLELLPPRPAFLRVVATPWAHVVVDGQRVDTTPFARPIPLRAGKHYVRFEHPAAPTERREVDLSPDETVLLDVTMKVDRPKVDAGADAGRAVPQRIDGGDASSDAPRPSP